jgi:ubiquinone/menaquinone biosynthesis C-methylase UbiE
MIQHLPFDHHVAAYEEWFKHYPYVFESELEAIKKLWPAGDHLVSLGIGSATGRFAKALGITEGLEPAMNMAAVAEARGVKTWCGVADCLPYKTGQFDVVLMNFCISYLDKPQESLKEAFRILKKDGCLIIGFVDKNSEVGKQYEKRKTTSLFYKQAIFYEVSEIAAMLTEAGFTNLSFTQTLFSPIDKITFMEPSIPGYGIGSYIFIKAIKQE